MVTSPSNLILDNQYFASIMSMRHSQFKAMRAGLHSTPTPVPRRACSQASKINVQPVSNAKTFKI